MQQNQEFIFSSNALQLLLLNSVDKHIFNDTIQHNCPGHLLLDILVWRTEESNKYRNGTKLNNNAGLNWCARRNVCQRPRSFKLKPSYVFSVRLISHENTTKSEFWTNLNLPDLSFFPESGGFTDWFWLNLKEKKDSPSWRLVSSCWYTLVHSDNTTAEITDLIHNIKIQQMKYLMVSGINCC